MEKQLKIIRTSLALRVKCKCGKVIAATMLYGGIEIDSEFMDTIAETANDDGKIEIIDTNIESVKLSGCKCT